MRGINRVCFYAGQFNLEKQMNVIVRHIYRVALSDVYDPQVKKSYLDFWVAILIKGVQSG